MSCACVASFLLLSPIIHDSFFFNFFPLHLLLVLSLSSFFLHSFIIFFLNYIVPNLFLLHCKLIYVTTQSFQIQRLVIQIFSFQNLVTQAILPMPINCKTYHMQSYVCTVCLFYHFTTISSLLIFYHIFAYLTFSQYTCSTRLRHSNSISHKEQNIIIVSHQYIIIINNQL